MEIAHSTGPEKAKKSQDMRMIDGRNVGGVKNMGGSSVAKPALRSLSVAPFSAPVVRRVDMKDLHGFDRDPVKDLIGIPTERDDSHASHAVSPLPRSLATCRCRALYF